MTVVSSAIAKMIDLYSANSDDSHHDINHFLKVWSYARTIGELENLDDDVQLTLELAAVVHDIACPLCREKYGNTNGIHQEMEGETLAKEFLEDFDIPTKIKERICYLVAHHHTYKGADGDDYQILLEADFLVNADESEKYHNTIESFKKNVFRTETGIKLLNIIYDER